MPEPLHREIIDDLLETLAGRSSRIDRVTAEVERVFEPRPDAVRERLQSLIEETLRLTASDRNACRAAVSTLIADTLSASRRRWRGLPPGALITSQIYDRGLWLAIYNTLEETTRLRLDSPQARYWELVGEACGEPTAEGEDYREWRWPSGCPLRTGLMGAPFSLFS